MLRRAISALMLAVAIVVFGAAGVAAQSKRLTPEEETARFQEQKAQAEAGDPAAMFRVAIAYFKGIGVDVDKIESAFWVQKAADEGHTQAVNRLAWHYRNGVGVIQNLPRSEKYYKQAYGLGVVGASVPLAAIYRTGEGRTIEEDGQGRVRENHAEAVRWALIASEAEIDRGQNILGELYRDGVGLKQSFAKALEWFEKAAAQGLPHAFYNASVIYRDQDIGFTDMEKGVQYLKNAADQGHLAAMVDLALSFANGTGVPQSYDLALEWYSRAAAKNQRAAVQLAKAYEAGVFGNPDHARAYKWYYVAKEAGEVTGIVGSIAMREKIQEPVRVAMEAEGEEWLDLHLRNAR